METLYTAQEAANIIAQTSGLTLQEALNRLAGTVGRTTQEAMNIYAGTIGLTFQEAANAKAGTVGLTAQRALNRLTAGGVSVYRYSSNLKPAIDSMATGRVAFVGIGDSNQIKDGHGYDEGFAQALGRAGFNCYGSALYAGAENNYIGSGSGTASVQLINGSALSGANQWATTTISNSFLNDRNLNHDGNSDSVNMQMIEYIGKPASGQSNGVQYGATSETVIPGRKNFFNTQSSLLRCRMKYGTSAVGTGGNLDISTRLTGPPFTVIGSAVNTSTSTGSDSIQTYVQTIVSSDVVIPTTNSLQFSAHRVSSGNTTSPSVFGDSTTRFDVTNPSGTTYRYTYDGTGTNPSITSSTIATGMVARIAGQNFVAGNNGVFTITASGADFFEITNASGVAENDKTLGTGYIGCNGPRIIYQEVIDDNVAAGFRHTSLYGIGGQSSYDMALWYTTRTTNAKKLYFQTIEETTNGGNVVVYIQTAANDTSETSLSITSSIDPAVNNSGAYSDNMTTLINAIRTTWITGCGFSAARLFIVIVPGHPLGPTYTVQQDAYNTVAQSIADTISNVSVVNLKRLFTDQEMVDRSYYLGQLDTFNMRSRGYAAMWRSVMSDIGKGPAITFPTVTVADNNATGFLSRASNLTGLTDLQSGTLSIVLYGIEAANDVTACRLLQGRDASGDVIFDLEIVDSGGVPKPRLRLFNTDGSVAQVSLFPTSALATMWSATRNHLLISWNTVGQLASFQIDCGPQTFSFSLVSAGIPALASVTNWRLFSDGAGNSRFDGAIGEFWLSFGNYTDFSIEANRLLFTNSDGNPLVLPDDGIVNGITPNMYFRGADIAAGTNRGSGGDFTVNGSFTVSSISG